MEVAPLVVCLGLKLPQFGALAQVATQSTPASAMSLATVAETIALLPAIMEAGGDCVRAIEMRGVWPSVLVVLAAPLLHPVMTPTKAKPQRIASSAPNRPVSGEVLATKPGRAKDCKLRSLRCG